MLIFGVLSVASVRTASQNLSESRLGEVEASEFDARRRMVKEAIDCSSPLPSPATIPSDSEGAALRVQYELRVEADWPLAVAEQSS